MVAQLSSQQAWNAGGSHPDGPYLPSTSRRCTEAEIDAYSQEVLESHASQSPDSSLGSYVTSLLRSSEEENVQDMADFDSLLELVQEHCACSESEAVESLQIIATAVRTNEIPNAASGFGGTGSVATPNHLSVDTSQQFEPELTDEKKKQLASPLHADDLIPVDLMGVLDDPSTPQNRARSIHENPSSSASDNAAFPPLGTAPAAASNTKKKLPKRTSSGATPQPTEELAEDLAAALFVQPRSRQSSIDETSPNLQSTSAPSTSPPTDYLLLDESTYRNTIEMLLSMNADLSEEAASAATQMSPQADVNVAQFLIDSALMAPPVCRHMLQSGCYRSDCQFSHDVNGHTCSFWLRGRCGKGLTCRFLHGFNPQLLEGIYQTESTSATASAASAVEGGSHQQPPAEFPDLSRTSILSASGGTASSIWGAGGGGNQSSRDSTSFANIASQGSAQFMDNTATQRGSIVTSSKPKKVDIPQEVWSAHENRDSSAFYIADPMERYYAVAAQSTRRADVVDLHFQSLKTFGVVLSQVLPAKLETHSQVWIVTGTGHSVSSRTHQKGGGALETAVMSWLTENGYEFTKGRDRNGLSGAVLVYQYQ